MKNCVICQATFTPRLSGRPQIYCSQKCSKIRHREIERLKKLKPTIEKQCFVCGKPFSTKKQDHKFCSVDCRYESQKLMSLSRWRARNPLPDNWNYDCDDCGVLVERSLELGPRNKGRYGRFCAVCTQKRKTARYRKKTARRQGVAKPSNIHYVEIFERDNGICWLCGEPVDSNLPRVSRMGGTIDHIVPISRGGSDVLDNCRLAHWICNNRKSNKLVEELYA